MGTPVAAGAPSIFAIKGSKVQPPEYPMYPLAPPPFLPDLAGKLAIQGQVHNKGLSLCMPPLLLEIVPGPHTSPEKSISNFYLVFCSSSSNNNSNNSCTSVDQSPRFDPQQEDQQSKVILDYIVN